jgi:hypothetical protein
MARVHAEETTDMNRITPCTRAALALLPLAGALLCACTTAVAPGRNVAAGTPAHAECLDPDRARSWAVLDNDDILVDAGVDHYRLELQPTCNADFEVALRFRGDPVMGRVCGYARDAILTDRGECRIDRVQWIPRAEYDLLLHPKKATDAPQTHG